MFSGLKFAIRSLIRTPGLALSIMPIVKGGPFDSPADAVEVSHAI